MIETAIYDRLKTVTPNVFPDNPQENTTLPFVVFRISSSEPQLHTGGVTDLTKYTVEVDCYAINKAIVSSLQAATKARLHGYRGGQLQGAFLQTESAEEIEDGFHGSQTFTAWASTANVQATQDATARIETGNNYIKFVAQQHGFFGSSPITREAFTGDLDNEITQACAAIQDIRQKLINLGLVEDQRA